MKPIRSYSGALLALLAVLSCSRGTYGHDTFPGNQDQTGQVALRITTDTKSVLPSTLETAVKTLLVVLCRDDDPSQWKSLYQQGDAPVMVPLRLNQVYTAYAFVNMGNVLADIPRAEGGALDFPAFSYTISSYEQLQEEGFPMAGKLSLSADKSLSESPFTLTVDRLMAKVQVNVDGVSMDEGCVYMRNVANTVYPFAAEEDRRARSRAQIFDGNTDWEAFQSAESMNGRNQTLVFYVPENCQGQLLSTQMQWQKSADYMDDQAATLCTYLEFQAQKGGTQDGVSGPVTYRCYLGENTANDFSVVRNGVYLAQLSLSWDGLFAGQTWRIDASGLSDARQLRLCTQARTLEEEVSDLGKVKRRKSFALYVNFSRDLGASWVEGAKDVNTWPFGWNLYIDGIRQQEGLEGTADGDIGWTFSSTASGDCLQITPGPAAVLKSEHTLQVVTADGQVASNSVRFQIEQPFTSRWTVNAVPHFVAQRGLLQCIDPETDAPSAEGVFHSARPDRIRIRDNGDGTAHISLLAPFEADSTAVYLTDEAGDRRCNVPLEALLPYFGGSPLRTCLIDEWANLRFAYYQDEALTQALTLSSDPENPVCGNRLDAELAGECLAPRAVSEQGKLAFERHVARDGSFFLRTYVCDYAGLSPSGTVFEVDQVQLSLEDYPSRGTYSTVFRAYNPWVHISGVAAGAVLNDYTLYREPNRNAPYTGWESAPSGAPEESANYTVGIGPLVALGKLHGYDVRFAESGSLVGSICSGTPGTVSPDCQPHLWSLRLSASASLSETGQEQLLRYLSRQGHTFINTEDMMDCLAQRGYSFIVGGAYLSEAAANQARPGTTIPGCSFSVYHNAPSYNWTLTYGMKGVGRSAILTRSAGKIRVSLQLRCPYGSSALSMPVLEAYMRLHVYLWPQAELAGGNRFRASVSFPYNQTEGLPDFSRKGAGLLDVAASLSTGAGIAGLESGGEAAAQMRGAATWRWSGSTPVQNLGTALTPCSPAPFIWASAGTLDTLAPGCFYRVSDFELRYDPGGTAHTYSSGTANELKLFVFYLYTGEVRTLKPSFYVP